jgi:hypothetical protein
MRTAAWTCAIVGGLALSIFLSADASAKNEHPYLLNCQLMDHSDPLYQQFCNGEQDRQGYVLCRDTICILVNFKSRYTQPQMTFAGDGSDHNNDLDTGPDRVATTAPPTSTPGAGGTPDGTTNQPVSDSANQSEATQTTTR